jgi:uncharacterized protein YdiU (UPF0061 family)
MNLSFDNRFVNDLPGDPITDRGTRQVRGAVWSRVNPTHVPKPTTAAVSAEMCEAIGISPAESKSELFSEVFGGNKLLDGMDPIATCYGGHQFGNWAGQLGDGRAISLGESINGGGERWELQLKGAGPTAYSRMADGRAVLRSSVREFLCSEAMFHLGVPTTRALSLVLTGEEIMRDMFYDGRGAYEPGAVVCRAAPSFMRFGHFELPAARRETELLEQLVMFTIGRDFPALGPPSRDTVLPWLMSIAERTASMVVHWMRVGFVHGVMNTDNMSILGLTIDYGPYGWLEGFDPDWTPNTTDSGMRRYRFGSQPDVAMWNLRALLQATASLLNSPSQAADVLEHYRSTVQLGYGQMSADKLGLPSLRDEQDRGLATELYSLLQLTETDMTLFYRGLAKVQAGCTDKSQLLKTVRGAYYSPEEAGESAEGPTALWLLRYSARLSELGSDDGDRATQMNKTNPLYVLRNYLAQEAIERAEEGDMSLVDRTLDVMRNPYNEQPGAEHFAEKRPEWARHRAGCSTLSCSS